MSQSHPNFQDQLLTGVVLATGPLRVSMNDLLTADKRGKWWLVGAGWSGNPLVEREAAMDQGQKKDREKGKVNQNEDEAVLELARRQGHEHGHPSKRVFGPHDERSACFRNLSSRKLTISTGLRARLRSIDSPAIHASTTKGIRAGDTALLQRGESRKGRAGVLQLICKCSGENI